MSGAIEIVKVAGLVTVQDGGRPGRMHEGIPPGGALVPELLARANRAVGNADDAAAIEVVGTMTVVARGGCVTVASEEGDATALEDGTSWRVERKTGLRARYVALGGGVDVPRVLGGRGTLVVAGFGGIEGRGLKAGDTLAVGGAALAAEPDAGASRGEFEPRTAIRVVLGPDVERFPEAEIGRLLSESFSVSPSSDRTGTRLVGAAIHALPADSPSAPMVAGAVEIPPSGEPIVLGPDHPTTGGYPVIAVVVRADLGPFHALPIGAAVRFARV